VKWDTLEMRELNKDLQQLIVGGNYGNLVPRVSPCMYVCKTLFNDASLVNSNSWFPQGASLAQEKDIYKEGGKMYSYLQKIYKGD
jgi:hypothetical protein